MTSAWPSVSYPEWSETCDTLHAHTQLLGKLAVALAPPERDLWMLVDDTADGASIYAAATVHEVDQVAVDLFRLTWDLADLAAFTNVLRAPHRETADTVKAYDGLTYCVTVRDRWAALLG